MTIAIGDVHGCYKTLMALLRKIPDDEIIFVGDLIDRGPDNLKCLNLIDEPWFYAVRGNHEHFMIDCFLGNGDLQLWYYNGGNWIENENTDYLRAMASKLERSVPLSITLKTKYGTIGICHAEPPTNDWQDLIDENITDEDIQRMLWDRYMIQMGDTIPPTKNIDMTLHGHTPVKQVEVAANAMFIDTGSYLKHYDAGDFEGVKIIRIDNILETV